MSSHVTVRGFTLENANGEGLLIGFDAPPPGAAPTNGIRDNEIGIWLSTIVTAHGFTDNEFHHVTTKVVTG